VVSNLVGQGLNRALGRQQAFDWKSFVGAATGIPTSVADLVGMVAGYAMNGGVSGGQPQSQSDGPGMRLSQDAVDNWGPQYSQGDSAPAPNYSLGADGVRFGGDIAGEYAGGQEFAADVRERSMALARHEAAMFAPPSQARLLDDGLSAYGLPKPGYPSSGGGWVSEGPAGISNVGTISATRFALDDLPAQYQSAYGPVRLARDAAGQGYLAAPIDDRGSVKFYSPPAGYDMPSLATLQARVWARGVADGVRGAPSAALNVFEAGADFFEGAFNINARPQSPLTRAMQDGRLSGHSLLVGLIESTPAGILTNMGIGTPQSLYNAGQATGTGAAFAAVGLGLKAAGVAGSKLSAWSHNYSLEWPVVHGRFGQGGSVAIPSIRNLRAEVSAALPDGFDLVRMGRGGTAIVRFGGETFYSVPKAQYSLISQLRTIDTMGDVFTQRVQAIADGLNPVTDLSLMQRARLDATSEGWLKNRFMSSYKGSYIDKQFGRELPDIAGGSEYTKMSVGPDVIRVGGGGAGLSYEITQLTPSLNAIYSHTLKYHNELLRYVTYK
jgi:hypothetical protein